MGYNPTTSHGENSRACTLRIALAGDSSHTRPRASECLRIICALEPTIPENACVIVLIFFEVPTAAFVTLQILLKLTVYA